MSTRWYPIYQRGNPQLRVFLPNFWMKLVRPNVDQPKNVVQFITSVQMTSYDIKNYLEKIYKIPVVEVKESIETGEFKRQPQHGYVIKDDDFKRAYVTLPRGTVFEFPDIFAKDKVEQEKEEYEKRQEEIKKGFKNYKDRNSKRPGLPGWFGL
ncbi:mitochondrial ribosomal protein L23 [Lycorma delicatula]|uniref:mitochondrial ribosomal protein L23 n=1 Tax=Lycorma delicatula TaxID=130591 RepID=UPI003F50ED33